MLELDSDAINLAGALQPTKLQRLYHLCSEGTELVRMVIGAARLRQHETGVLGTRYNNLIQTFGNVVLEVAETALTPNEFQTIIRTTSRKALVERIERPDFRGKPVPFV